MCDEFSTEFVTRFQCTSSVWIKELPGNKTNEKASGVSLSSAFFFPLLHHFLVIDNYSDTICISNRVCISLEAVKIQVFS